MTPATSDLYLSHPGEEAMMLMRDDDGTPDYMREGAEPPVPPLSVPVPPPRNFKGGDPCPMCRGACCWEWTVGELVHTDPTDLPDAFHRCPACEDGTACEVKP